MPDIKLHAVHFALSAHFPDIAAAFHQIDLIPVHAFDDQIVFRLVGDGQRLVQIQRQAVGAGLTEIEDLDVLNLSAQRRQVEFEIDAIDNQVSVPAPPSSDAKPSEAR